MNKENQQKKGGYIMNDFQRALVASSPMVTEKLARMPTIKERIALAVTQAEQRLRDVKEAQDILDKHPDLERLLDLMQRGHF